MALYKWQSVPAPARTEDWIALMNRGLSLTRMVVHQVQPRSQAEIQSGTEITGQSARDPKYKTYNIIVCVICIPVLYISVCVQCSMPKKRLLQLFVVSAVISLSVILFSWLWDTNTGRPLPLERSRTSIVENAIFTKSRPASIELPDLSWTNSKPGGEEGDVAAGCSSACRCGFGVGVQGDSDKLSEYAVQIMHFRYQIAVQIMHFRYQIAVQICRLQMIHSGFLSGCLAQLVSNAKASHLPQPATMDLALIPGFLHLQFLITCSMQKRREKSWGISSHDPWHGCHMFSHILSTAKLYMRLILHYVLTTRMGQVPAESCTE